MEGEKQQEYIILSYIIIEIIHVHNYKVWSLSGSRHPVVMATTVVKEEIKEEINYALK